MTSLAKVCSRKTLSSAPSLARILLSARPYTIERSTNENESEIMHVNAKPQSNQLRPSSYPTNLARRGNQKYGSSRNPNNCIGFSDFETDVRREFDHLLNGKRIHLQTLPNFSRILNGLRPNELTIFTGPTGCGKTTILSQISMDYTLQDVSVLWGSFEIRNSRLAHVMVQQISSDSLLDKNNQLDLKRFERAAFQLRNVPLKFMDMFGSTGLDSVLDTMEMAMQSENPPNLIILDNLQFMLSGQGQSSLDRWELMDRAITNIRSFCNSYKTHVILVVHPRKELDDTPLGLASVSGTAKATQEADNVIILQKIGEKRYLEIKKNRFYGDLGRVRIGFIPHRRIVSEIKDDNDFYPSADKGNGGSI